MRQVEQANTKPQEVLQVGTCCSHHCALQLCLAVVGAPSDHSLSSEAGSQLRKDISQLEPGA